MALPKAKARLSNMKTQEVSMVDRAANNREFVYLKRDRNMPKTTRVTKDDKAASLPGTDATAPAAATQPVAGDPPTPLAAPPQQPAAREPLPGVTNVKETKQAGDGASVAEQVSAVTKFVQAVRVSKALSLPGAAKQAVLDVIASGIEDLTSLSSIISEAQVDDSAPVPDELAQAIAEIGTNLAASAQQFMPADDSAQDQDPNEQTQQDQQSDQQQPTGAQGQTPPEQVQMSAGPGALGHLSALATSLGDVAKAKQIDDIAKGHADEDAADAVVLQKSASTLDVVTVAKVGKKMASRRLGALKNAWSIITSLLDELDGPGDAPAGAAAGAAPAAARAMARSAPTSPSGGGVASAPPSPSPAPMQKNAEGEADLPGDVLSVVAQLAKAVAAQASEMTTMRSLVTEVAKSAGLPTSSGHDESTPVRKGRATNDPVWPQDLSAKHREREMAKGK